MKKDKTVFLIRHGQSTGNISPTYQSIESKLSDEGQKQAELIANRVSNLDIDGFISSPILRARQTAEIISKKTGKKPEFSDLFVERIKPKSTDGKSWEDKEASEVFREWEKSLVSHNMKVEDGENFSEITQRADKALKHLLQEPGENILVVTHGVFLRVIVARILIGKSMTPDEMGRFIDRTSMENTAITVIKFDDDYKQDYMWRLWILNDHSHFAE